MNVLKMLTLFNLVAAFLFPGQVYSQDADYFKTILTNGNVIDCTGNPMKEDVTIVITGNRIPEISEGEYTGDANPNTRTHDGGYVLPRFWNIHSHLSDLLPDVNRMLGDEPLLPVAIRTGRNAMGSLKRGFTALRMTGERDYIDVDWRDVFNAEVFVGPRIFRLRENYITYAPVFPPTTMACRNPRRIVRHCYTT